MSRRMTASGLLLLVCCPLPSCVRALEHDPTAAATAAAQFAETAFVKKDFPAAQGLLAPETRQTMTPENLSAAVSKMHPAAYPRAVKAVEYEPMPGKAAMLIYLKGSGENEEFYYRFVLTGTKPSGYQVSSLWRGSGPYPASPRKPL